MSLAMLGHFRDAQLPAGAQSLGLRLKASKRSGLPRGDLRG